jgi:hypothetical protein
MKRVSFYKNNNNGMFIVEEVEELSKGAELLKDYFWFFGSHCNPKDVLRFKSAAFFYSCYIPRRAELQKKFDVCEISFEVPSETIMFFDMRKEEIDLFQLPPQKAICLTLNGKRVGVYFTKSQLLIATDWTHNLECIYVLEQIIPELGKIFKKRPSKPPKPKFKITFGSDPEFEILHLLSKQIIPASSVVKGGTSSRDEIGVDGAGSQVEIRPAPSGNVNRFISNIRNILRRFASEYKGFTLSVQGDKYPLGGHIHLSVSPDEDIIKLLDNWIGRYVIDLSGVARGSYKKLGAIERKPWGFEYRTPPAAIFLKPSVLAAVLKIIKRVISAYYSEQGISLYPVDEEIKRLGVEKEWEVLNKFITKYHDLNKDVLRQWRIATTKFFVELIFKDDWQLQVKEFVRELFFSRIDKRLIEKLNKRGIYKILFYGLKKERGEVCNFKSRLFSMINHRYSINNGIAFGFPWIIRMADELTDELKDKWLVLIDDVINVLREMV